MLVDNVERKWKQKVPRNLVTTYVPAFLSTKKTQRNQANMS